MKSTNVIRPLSLALIKKDDKYLVFKATDPNTEEKFYRPLGGGIEFGETSAEALIREFKEEIDADIEPIKILNVFENMFTYEGIEMHELVFLYEAKFSDTSWYQKDGIDINARHPNRKATWVSRETLLKANFYPEGIKKLL